MATIHPTAIVQDGAELGPGVEIGPYCIVGERVCLGAGTRLMAHVFIDGRTRLGENCTVYPFASLGTQTQDMKYAGGEPRVEIGAGTTIREYVTVNAATADGDATVVGDGCLLMAYSHVAHDCLLGNRVIVANCGTLAGHVELEDHVIIGGLSGIHQFVRIGAMTIVGGCSKVTQDIPPYMTADGHPLRVRGLNRIGLERRAVSRETQRSLKLAYRILYRRQLATSAALAQMRNEVAPSGEIEHLIAFIEASARGIVK